MPTRKTAGTVMCKNFFL